MLRLEGISKRFGDVVAVRDVTLEVPRGELLTLLGPSGCGKTTTLRMIAGFEPATAGRIFIEDRDITALPPQKRGVGMVFQNYALFPHLDVFENVAFGLKARGTPREELPRRVQRALELVDLPGYARRRVQQLSGGQQQRVALARALAPEPPVLLLDEPLSNLDAALRERTRDELRALLRRVGITAVFVTHDQEEAFALSDRVALMNGGGIEQVGTPEQLYGEPATAFAAAFVGRASFLQARVAGQAGAELLCELVPGVCWRARPAPGFAPAPGAAVRLMARPEALELAPGEGAGGSDALPGEVLERRFAGAVTFYRIRAAAAGAGGPEAASTGNRPERVPGPEGDAGTEGVAGTGAGPEGAELLVQAGASAAARGRTVRVRPAPGGVVTAYPTPES
jgi:ABC-type Fe3+/spermidine/putrescine transport system ATPase subunit